MGAFLGYERIGLWASNGLRDAFLDWFADHRCKPHDARWEYCKSDSHRWMGCCIELSNILPRHTHLNVTERELADARSTYGPDFASLLARIDRLSAGQWHFTVDSREAIQWRDH